MVSEDLKPYDRSFWDYFSELRLNSGNGASDLVCVDRKSGGNIVGGASMVVITFGVPRFEMGLS